MACGGGSVLLCGGRYKWLWVVSANIVAGGFGSVVEVFVVVLRLEWSSWMVWVVDREGRGGFGCGGGVAGG